MISEAGPSSTAIMSGGDRPTRAHAVFPRRASSQVSVGHGVTVSLKAVLTLFAAAVLLAAASMMWLDAPVARYALSRPPVLRAVAEAITRLGLSGYMLVGAAAVGLAAFGLGRTAPRSQKPAFRVLGERALFVFVAVALSGVLAQILKHLVGRARPRLIDTAGVVHFVGPSIKASLASLPSGHTTSIFALTVALALMLPRWRWPLMVPAGLVAASRALVGAHYVSDVIAGAALGAATSVILATAFARRNLAFARAGNTLVLKGRGSVWPAVLYALRPTGRAQ